MKRSQELQIEINKLRQQIMDLPDDGTAEQIAEIRQAMSLRNEKMTALLWKARAKSRRLPRLK